MIPIAEYGGLSFIVRCHNEEATIRQSLKSLHGLTIQHEIIVILHRCTDRSEQIVTGLKEEGMPIRIFKHDVELSQVGYQTLATPNNRPNSIVSHMTLYYSLPKYQWKFRWDSDFFCNDKLFKFLNEFDYSLAAPTTLTIGCRLSDSVVNAEQYLHNCVVGFTKYFFWDVPVFDKNYKDIKLHDIEIDSYIPEKPKTYWSKPPWFFGKDQTLENRYKVIERLLGPEPIGMAAASNPECDQRLTTAREMEQTLIMLSINPYT